MHASSDADAGFSEFIEKALGSTRIQLLADLEGRVRKLHSVTANAGTTEVILVPMTQRKARTWRRLANERGEDWAFIDSADGETTLAIDEPSELAQDDPAAAVVFPELHTRLVSWWLAHAWRSVDLFQDTLESLQRWRITSAAVTGRALIEEAGCLAYEAAKLADAWQTAKMVRIDGMARATMVRAALSPMLYQASFGSRTEEWSSKIRATNVLTYVQKLAKATGDSRFSRWYDWLSDAAHPAFDARIALASAPLRHDSEAVVVRSYNRSPMVLENGPGEQTVLENPIASRTADALVACAVVVCQMLDQSLAVVDDFGLTTSPPLSCDRRMILSDCC